jgi:uncharacterized membrane protein YdcZ (DUF606 family)
VCYVFLSLIGFPIAYLIASEDRAFDQPAEDIIFTVIMGSLIFLVSIVVSFLNFVVAYGLKKRRKWAWIGGLILGVLYTPSICFPFGAVILFALFKNQKAFDAT